MRHKIKLKKLNRTSSHRRAMLANMAVALIMNEQIRTTLVKAKVIRPVVEKLVTRARENSLAARRLLISEIKDKDAVNKLMSELAERYKTRAGGYTRIVKIGNRYGDMAPMAYIEFVDRNPAAKGSLTPRNLHDQEVANEVVTE